MTANCPCKGTGVTEGVNDGVGVPEKDSVGDTEVLAPRVSDDVGVCDGDTVMLAVGVAESDTVGVLEFVRVEVRVEVGVNGADTVLVGEGVWEVVGVPVGVLLGV